MRGQSSRGLQPNRARSASAATKRLRQPLEYPHDGEPVAGLGAVGAVADEAEEVLHLEAERLVVRDLRAEDVTGARAPLAVGLRGRLRRLLVDGDLALELHVVADGHLVSPDRW